MKRIILSVSLLLSACCKDNTGLASTPKMPPLPTELAAKPKTLPKLEDPSMGALVTANADTSSKYNAVSFQLVKLIDLYNCVRTAINENKEVKCQ